MEATGGFIIAGTIFLWMIVLAGGGALYFVGSCFNSVGVKNLAKGLTKIFSFLLFLAFMIGVLTIRGDLG